jgi:hypothetical protein
LHSPIIPWDDLIWNDDRRGEGDDDTPKVKQSNQASIQFNIQSPSLNKDIFSSVVLN